MTDPQHTTYDDYIASEQYFTNLGDCPINDESLKGLSGYVYLDSFYIIQDDKAEYKYFVPVFNDGIATNDLGEAQEYLWNELVDSEIN